MKSLLNLRELQMMWIVGATERLVSLGIMNPNLPLRLVPEAQEIYLVLDDEKTRRALYNCDEEVMAIFSAMVNSECPEIDNSTIDVVGKLLLKYKNNREEVVKDALERQFNR